MGDKHDNRFRPLVVQFITRLENGGAQRHVLHLCEHLDTDRFEVCLAFGPGAYLDDAATRIQNLRLLELPYLRRTPNAYGDLHTLVFLRAFLARESKHRPVILQTHSSKAGVLGRLSTLGLGNVVRIHTVHGFGFRGGQNVLARNVFRTLERGAAKFCDWTLCVSAYDQHEGALLGLLSFQNSSIIYPGVDFELHRFSAQWRAQFRAELGIPQDAPVIGTVACLKPQKAPLDFVDCAQRVLALKEDAHFIYVGDGDLRDDFLRHISHLELGGRFHFLGWSDRVPEMMSAIDVFVLLSLFEGLPRAILEARGAKRPSVLTDICGNSEAMGNAGCLVGVHQVDAAAKHIVKLLEDEALYFKLQEETQNNLKPFDIKHVVPQHTALFDTLLAEILAI